MAAEEAPSSPKRVAPDLAEDWRDPAARGRAEALFAKVVQKLTVRDKKGTSPNYGLALGRRADVRLVFAML